MERTAEFKAAVLLSGETGTGLEILARAIHAQSERRNQPFVALHCSAMPADQLESELMGGSSASADADTRNTPGLLAEAEGGTLFLDEVCALPRSLQIALLQILRHEQLQLIGAAKPCPVNVRVITATSRDLEDELAAGRFDRDLAKILSAFRLVVPPLRDRPKDIPLLVDYFLAQACMRHGRPTLEISSDAIDVLVAYDWPGNVRELELVVERTAMLASGDRITGRDLHDSLVAASRAARGGRSQADFRLKPARKALEASMIRQVLSITGGNRTHAAKLLEISHRALLYKIKEHGIRD